MPATVPALTAARGIVPARRRHVFTVAVSAVAVLSLAACTSVSSGQGAVVGSSGAGTATGFPTTSSAPSASGTSAASSPTASPTTSAVPRRRLSVTGGFPAHTYDVSVWDSDDIAECSAHAYGDAMIRFLGAHPCNGAHRVLATLPLNGRTVALSLISTGFRGTPTQPYAATEQFIKLEEADNTGAIDDLLRDGGTLPGAQSIPPSEAFTVLSQDDGVTVFDAWYLDGRTTDQDATLVTLERNLFLTPLQNA